MERTEAGRSRRVTRYRLAKILEVDRAAVTRAVQSGRLLVGEDGKLDLDESISRWNLLRAGTRPDVDARLKELRESARPAIPPAVRAATITQEQEVVLESAPENGDEGPSATGDLQKHHARRLAAQNALARIEIDLRRHRRHMLSATLDEAQSIGGMLRAAADRLVDQSAPLLAAQGDKGDRLALLSIRCEELRRLFRREFPRALRRLRKQ